MSNQCEDVQIANNVLRFQPDASEKKIGGYVMLFLHCPDKLLYKASPVRFHSVADMGSD